ncbi:MAG: hypothetical protein M1824_003640 [Vezdaea acicularis]|nr:MAG: hypothetical protein M1824_003640 [Vezdaea acicularis]
MADMPVPSLTVSEIPSAFNNLQPDEDHGGSSASESEYQHALEVVFPAIPGLVLILKLLLGGVRPGK